MKTNITQSPLFPGSKLDWWKWDEYCDKCGKMIFSRQDSTHSEKPDTKEADFCMECICDLRSKKISYAEAKKLYKK